jgi:hypothetical protein
MGIKAHPRRAQLDGLFIAAHGRRQVPEKDVGGSGCRIDGGREILEASIRLNVRNSKTWTLLTL